MKKIKRVKVLLLLVCLLLPMMFATPVEASYKSENKEIGIVGFDVPAETLKYANSVYYQHLHALFMDEKDFNISQCYISKGFTFFDKNMNMVGYGFPVIKNHVIVSVLEVCMFNGQYQSTMSDCYADSLNKLLLSIDTNITILVNDGNYYYYDGKLLGNLYLSDSDNCLSSVIYYDISNLDIQFSLSDIYTVQKHLLRKNDGPRSYKTLSVKGVPQIGPTCWAATCAANINYMRGKNTGCETVAKYVYGKNWQRGAGSEQIKKAYKHWGIGVTQKGRVTFSKVKEEINSNHPMHLGLQAGSSGHSIGLIGYEDYSGVKGANNSKVLIILEPNGGVRKTITLSSDGNFKYYIAGGGYQWNCTRILR